MIGVGNVQRHLRGARRSLAVVGERLQAGWRPVIIAELDEARRPGRLPGAAPSQQRSRRLHALDHPETVIGVADNWILEPTDPWGRTGYVPNVVFCNAEITEPDGEHLRLYWGGADTVVCTGTVAIRTLIDACLTTSPP